MTDLQTLIRTVDPKDRAACDELNARFWCFLNKRKFLKMEKHIFDGENEMELCVVYEGGGSHIGNIPAYDKSLDALKAVQGAELGDIHAYYEGSGNSHQLTLSFGLENEGGYVDEFEFSSDFLPTMQLAWMDALHQTITHKRENEQ